MELSDIREIDPLIVPDHDILCAGFPCQPFSLAGVSKKASLGRKTGFADIHQGNLFFTIVEIARLKRPPIIFLENVKNLLSHDRYRTYARIKSELEQLNYRVESKVIDAAGWVPQHRERVYIICFNQEEFSDEDIDTFTFPSPPKTQPVLNDILEDEVDIRYTLTDNLWIYLQEYAERHRRKGNGFGFGLADRHGVARTLSARYHKDGSEILIPQGNGMNPRRLTPREALLLMGFDDKRAKLSGFLDGFPQVVSDTQAYRQLGNAVCPPVIEAIGNALVKFLSQARQ